MLKLEELLKYLKVILSNELATEDKELIEKLGKAAIEQVESNLRPGVAIKDGEHNLLMLCVAITYYQYALITAQKQAQAVKVGDVSVQYNGEKWIQSAQKLKDYYYKATRKYMRAKFVEFISV